VNPYSLDNFPETKAALERSLQPDPEWGTIAELVFNGYELDEVGVRPYPTRCGGIRYTDPSGRKFEVSPPGPPVVVRRGVQDLIAEAVRAERFRWEMIIRDANSAGMLCDETATDLLNMATQPPIA
jgi:hypothetical protein